MRHVIYFICVLYAFNKTLLDKWLSNTIMIEDNLSSLYIYRTASTQVHSFRFVKAVYPSTSAVVYVLGARLSYGVRSSFLLKRFFLG